MLDDGWWASVLRDEEAKLPARGGSASSGNGYHPVSATNSQADWEAARVLYHSDGTIELEATGFNRGGLLVAWNSLRGFVPASHLIGFPNEAPELERKSALAERVSQHLSLKVIEFDPIKGRIVFSERAARSGPGSRQTLLQRLQTGDHVDGVVTNVCDFGVFVDLGGIEGLIHVSEVSWNRVAHPRDVVAVNQSVNVLVMSVDRDQGRVALSLKRQRPDPWASVESRYSIGQLIDGKITNVVNFGAFIALEDGLEGLIHISELAEGQFFHPRNVVTEGEVVRAKIISIDGNHRRLSLSLRRLAEGPLTVSTITA
ncbi:MAG: 30S ribosomal protein S1 [Anaerolineales bacterium]